ncbi:hypothetical protein F4677DRAFT_428431 [Hypoxylon crocopeplum]|nr:hypothetical protein F4677DRAFT_428431 [Hypoxylon crocopeplum]
MKPTSVLSNLSAFVLVGTIGSSTAAVLPRNDADTIANFGRIGICMSYFGAGDTQKELAPCSTWCPTQDPNSDPNGVGCKGPGVPQDQIDPSVIEKDDDGNLWTAGTCVCKLEIAEAIIDVVIQALSQLDNVLCAVVLTAVTTLVEQGLDAVPGGASIAAVEKAVEGAKTFAENGLDAVSFFGDWIGGSCNIHDFSFNLDDIFQGLTDASDAIGESKGCLKKAGC